MCNLSIMKKFTSPFHKRKERRSDTWNISRNTRMLIVDAFSNWIFPNRILTDQMLVYFPFLSDPGKPGVRSLGPDVCPSLTERPFVDLTDVTLADEDTKSILTDNANRVIQDKISNIARGTTDMHCHIAWNCPIDIISWYWLGIFISQSHIS